MIARINGEIILHAYGNSNKTGLSDSNSTQKICKITNRSNRSVLIEEMIKENQSSI